jgi:hypothetical protein
MKVFKHNITHKKAQQKKLKKKIQTNLQKLHVYEKYGEDILRMQFVGFF